ncbi:MAG TPA: hypothetical protein VIM89_00195 [Mucilaginibacter sp.]
MTKPDQPDNNNQPSQELPNSNPVHYTEQENQNGNSRTSTQNPKYLKKIWKFIGENGAKAHFSNLTSFFMLVVTIILAWYTFRLFNISNKSIAVAITADSIAKASLDESKINNFKAAVRQKTIDSSTAITDAQKLKRDTNFVKKQTQGIDSQIVALQETRKEFEIENRPLIQAIDLQFDTLKPGKDVCISFNFRNYGKQPVRCLTSQYAIDYQLGKDFKMKPKVNWNYNFINGYLTSGNYSHHFWRSADTVNTESVRRIINGDISTYVFGKLIYQNTVTLKKTEYDFNFRLKFVPAGFGVESITNEVIPIKN